MPENRIHIDRNVTAQLRKGSRDAFSLLFKHHHQKLYFFSLGYLKSEKDAEEIVQETFLKLWERRHELDPERSVQAYLFKIAFNFIRKRMVRMIRENEFRDELAGELTNFDDNTANALDYHFLLEHISRLISHLPPRQKQVLELRKLQGYSLPEIAEMLGLSQKTVEAHLTASLKFLKDKLHTENPDELILLALFCGIN